MTSTLVATHVAAGAIALVAGAAALTVTKGARAHRLTGNVFFVSMLVMASLGAYAALAKPEMISSLNGVLTVYLVLTAWTTIRRRPRTTHYSDWLVALVALAVGAAHVVFGLQAADSPDGMKQGFPAPAYFIFGSVALLASLLDARMIMVGGLAGAQRVLRHLWRMCFALFIATASLFLGQQQLFPESLQGTLVLAAPVLAVVIAMLYWLGRVSLTGRYTKPRT